MQDSIPENIEYIVLGGGCFWCLEAIFKRIKGVITVESGYAGGNVPNPTYEAVCTGKTGHAEVTKISFDKTVITLEKILKIFFLAHDPTTLNRQGNDVGTEYRSIILFNTEDQKQVSEKIVKQIQADSKDKVVTELKQLTTFYKAEGYHQDYYDNNTSQPYCRWVIQPKLDKVLKEID